MYISLKKQKNLTDDFLKFLINRIFVVGLKYIKDKENKLSPLDEKLKLYFPEIKQKKAKQIIIIGLKNLIVRKTENEILISINETTKIPMNTKYLLKDVCQFIDKGNIDTQPFGIFTYVFNYVCENFNKLYEEYSYGVFI